MMKPSQAGVQGASFQVKDSSVAGVSNSSETRFLDLETLTYSQMIACGRVIREFSQGATSSEAVAGRIVQYFYDRFRIPGSGERACALVRCFQTYPYEGLQGYRKQTAERLLDGHTPQLGMRCLALLASRGVEPAWDSVGTSEGHAAIPLPSVEVIRQTPMIARLLLQMGVPMTHIVPRAPDAQEFRFDEMSGNFDVFHVERARGSNYIPAQNTFVKPYGVRSVVGMGGLLPGGEIFILILFSRVRISREVAGIFRTLALNVKLALLPFDGEETFEEQLS
jgi:hypothetical protein